MLFVSGFLTDNRDLHHGEKPTTKAKQNFGQTFQASERVTTKSKPHVHKTNTFQQSSKHPYVRKTFRRS